MEKRYRWYKLADTEAEIPMGDNNMAVVELNGRKMSLARYQDRLFAFSYACPHASGILSEGHIDARGQVVCPVHGYKFNIENGRNTSGEGYHLKHWPVESREEGVFVAVDFDWL